MALILTRDTAAAIVDEEVAYLIDCSVDFA